MAGGGQEAMDAKWGAVEQGEGRLTWVSLLGTRKGKQEGSSPSLTCLRDVIKASGLTYIPQL